MIGRTGSVAQSRHWLPFAVCMLVSLAVSLALPQSATGQPKTVLTIYSDERQMPVNQLIDTALRDALGVETHSTLTYLTEFLDFTRFGNPAYDKLASDFLRNKYAGQSPDVIIAVGPLAFHFLYSHRADLFSGIPVVLVGVSGESLQAQPLPPNFVGVPTTVEAPPTIQLALRLQPDAREIVIVTGTSEFDRAWEARLRRDLPHLQTSVPIRYLSGLALDDVLRELSRLSPNTIVYFPSFFRDGAGRTYIPGRALRRMADVSTAPMYASYSVLVGTGILGGYMLWIEDASRQAAGLARRILDGEKITQADMPPAVPSHYLVDWRQLQRWHLSEARLPPGTIVLYRESGPWQRYKRYIIGGFLVILVEMLLILGLLWQRAKRRKVETNLAISEERFRLAVEASKSVGWEWDLKTERDSWFGDLQTMFGIPSDTFVGRAEDFHRYVHPEDRRLVAKAVADAKQSRKPYAAEFRVVWPDGTVRWVAAKGKFYYGTKGDPERMLGMAVDITERKWAEEALQKSEARERTRSKELETILDAVPVPVRIAHDPACRRMTGNRAAYEQARVPAGSNFSKSAPPDEQPRYRLMEDGVAVAADTLPMQQAAATGKPVYGRALTVVYEDGTKRETVENAVPLLDEAGKPRGAVGTSIDLTELKQAEQALRESEDKLRLLLDSTAEAIYGIDLEHRSTFCNPACLRILGYERIDEVLGKNMHDLIHHTRADGTLMAVEECRVHEVIRTGQGVHADDEVLWRANGTSFPAEYWSYPQRRGQEVVGAVIAFIDITQRKLAEAALAGVSRKLIEAQEQERTRIARELHDDIGQRLAMLANDLGQLQQESPDLPAEVQSRMGELWQETSEIATDIQSLSHELHSAKLEYLGITAAIRGFCKEFGEQQNVEIDFRTDDLPRRLPADISLCLFRVLQEALHNSAKHSGARHFEVRLSGTSEEVHLTVSDAGIGFDREEAKQSPGLGLVSMEERLKLIKGTLSIETQPQRGTTIDARVPFRSRSDSLSAVG